jgi:hypothetical protein
MSSKKRQGRAARTRLGTLMLAIAIGVSAHAQRPSGTPQPSPSQIDQDMRASPQAYPLLKDLTTRIGPRMTGSREGHQAEQWALGQFHSMGYANAHFVPFTFDRWTRGALSLTIGGRSVPAVAFGGSPAANFDTDIVDMHDGIDADYAAAPERARGKVVLVYLTVSPDSADSTPFLMRWDKIKLAIRYGAKALVFINRGQGDVLSTGSGWFDGAIPIPVLMVGHDSGLALRAQLKRTSLPVRVSTANGQVPGEANDIVATLPGRDPKAEKIVFGAHLDSWDLATGALDNGAGATALLDVARVFKQRGYRPKRTIQFVLFMGEEQGDLGSKALAKADSLDRGSVQTGYMFNTDMSYDPTALNTWGFEVDRGFVGGVTADIHDRYPSFSLDVPSRPMPGGDSDAYLAFGVPVFYLMGNQTPDYIRCQHADCDRIDIIQPDKLMTTAAIEAVVLWRLSNADQLPSRRLTGPAIDDYMTRNKLPH